MRTRNSSTVRRIRRLALRQAKRNSSYQPNDRQVQGTDRAGLPVGFVGSHYQPQGAGASLHLLHHHYGALAITENKCLITTLDLAGNQVVRAFVVES
jgi:hypothetical protein